jgi:DNA-binding transcriptional MocR family regulator
MRKLYGERREYFVEQFNKYLGQHLTVKIPEAGLHFVARLRRKSDFPSFVRARTETGIMPTKMSFYSIDVDTGPTFLFGFAAWSRAQIREGLAKLALAFERLRKTSAPAATPDELDPTTE